MRSQPDLTPERDRSSPSPKWQAVGLSLVLLLSLALRLWNLDAFLSIDEPRWEERSQRFLAGLRSGDLAETYQSEHPGVLTMRAGAAAIRIVERVAPLAQGNGPWSRLAQRWLLPRHTPDVAGLSPITFWARRIIAVTTWLGIVAAAALVWRWRGPTVALVATTLIALDPFYLAYSRLHHLDGLLCTFVMLSVLATLVYWERGRHWYDLAQAGIFVGLAIASKSPGILLAPWIVGICCASWIRAPRKERPHQLRRELIALTACGILALGTLLLAWPALRADPVRTLTKVWEGAERQGINPHENGNFFMGQIVAVPGPVFYPVAWLFRATPWTVLGLITLAIPAKKRTLGNLLLGLFAIGYMMLASLASKQFDRYLLPVFGPTDVLAAIGLVRLWRWARKAGAARIRAWHGPASVVGLVITLLAIVLPGHPYYTACFNPLLGGGKVAQGVFLTGWGEGMDQVAEYLNELPNAQDLHISSQVVNELTPFCQSTVTIAGRAPLAEPDYYVLYSSHAQRGFVPEVMNPLWGIAEPELVASAAGVEYAWVYRNSFYEEPARQAADLILAKGDVREDALILNTDAVWARDDEWDIETTVISAFSREDYVLSGLNRAADAKTTLWVLHVPEMDDAAIRQIIENALQEHSRQVSQHVFSDLSLTEYALEDQRFLPTPATKSDVEFGQLAQLEGSAILSDSPSQLLARLHWRCLEETDQRLKVFVHLLDAQGNIISQSDAEPQDGGRPTSVWQPGEELIDDHTIPLPGESLPKGAAIRIGLYDAETLARLPVHDDAGSKLGDSYLLPVGE